MAILTLAVHMLISAPGDIPKEDIRRVMQSISQWNYTIGRHFNPHAVTVLPVSWTDHAYSVIGVRPQQGINSQLVDECDLALAMFANRLGTPTGQADSGTAEEIQRIRDAGRHVSVVRNISLPLETGPVATEEKLRLERYLESMKSIGLIFEYRQEADLAGQINAILSSQALSFAREAQQAARSEAGGGAAEGSPENEALGVWPRMEVVEEVGSDSKGRLRTKKRWYLVLSNKTGAVARDVSFAFDDDGKETAFALRVHAGPVEIMPPEAEQRFAVLAAAGSRPQALCTVSWTDPQGEGRQTQATVRRS